MDRQDEIASLLRSINQALGTNGTLVFVGTENNVNLLRQFAVDGQEVILGGPDATQFVQGDDTTVTDMVPVWEPSQGKMVLSSVAIVYHPYDIYMGGESDGMDWNIVDTIGTGSCALVDNVLTLNDATGISADMYVRLQVSISKTKDYKISSISGNDLTLSATPESIVTGSDVKVYMEEVQP